MSHDTKVNKPSKCCMTKKNNRGMVVILCHYLEETRPRKQKRPILNFFKY